MKKSNLIFFCSTLLVLGSFCSCQTESPKHTSEVKKEIEIKTEEVNYSSDGINLQGFAAYSTDRKDAPVIIIVHEWWGLNDYAKNRAKQLAKLGYFVFAVDMYGDGKIANNPTEASEYAMPFYKDPVMANKRLEAAIKKIKTYTQADTREIVAIGYCFGGSMVLNAARAGLPFDKVVSFHGGLAGLKPEKDKLKAKILICHGEDDQFVSKDEVQKFKKEMDSIGADYTFKTYPKATHAFSNPDATANGKKFDLPIAYNKKADQDSWNDFMQFLKK